MLYKMNPKAITVIGYELHDTQFASYVLLN